MINKQWCDPRNISSLSRFCLPHLEHLSIICRPFYLPREFPSIIVTAVYIPAQADTCLALLSFTMCSAATLTNILTLPLSSRGILTKPTSGRSCRTFTNMYPVQLEDRIHWMVEYEPKSDQRIPALHGRQSGMHPLKQCNNGPVYCCLWWGM